MRRDSVHRTLPQVANADLEYPRWLLAEPLRRQMSELLGFGLAMEGRVIGNG